MSTTDFHPGTDAVEGRSNEDHLPNASGVQEPEDKQDQGRVREEVDGGQPVDGCRVDVVERREDVADDAVLQPHGSVAGRNGAEEE